MDTRGTMFRMQWITHFVSRFVDLGRHRWKPRVLRNRLRSKSSQTVTQMNANHLVRGLRRVSQTGSADYSYFRHMGLFWSANRLLAFVIRKCLRGGRMGGNQRWNCSSPWQMLLSDVPLMWKPASQLQCCSWFTWAQRGLRLKAGSFTTLHSGGAALRRQADEACLGQTNKEKQDHGVMYPPVWVWCWHWDPLHLWGQMHLYWLTPSTQVPPFWQGLRAHSLMTVDEEQNGHCSRASFLLPSRRSERRPVSLLPVFYSISAFEGDARPV